MSHCTYLIHRDNLDTVTGLCPFCDAKRAHPRQQAFTRSHHRASMRMRAGTLSGAMSGDPRDQRR